MYPPASPSPRSARRGDLSAAAEEPDRSEVDPFVPGLDHEVENAVGVGHAGMDPDGELERTPADRCVGNGDGIASPYRMLLAYIAVPTSTAVEGGDGVGGGGGRGRLATQASGERLDLIDQRPLEHGVAAVAHHELATARAERADHLDPAAVAVVEAAAERDRSDSPARQLPGREHALRVASDRFHRVDLAVDHGLERDVLPGEPAHHVELVHSHVEQWSAAGEAEGGGGRFAVPLPRLDEGDLAERAAVISSRSARSSGTNRRQ